MINKIKTAIKDGTFFSKAKNRIKLFVMKPIGFILNKKINLINNKIIFLAFQGDYSCNPKAIADYIIKNKLDYELIWVVREKKKTNLAKYPKELKIVERNTIEFYKEASSCKFIIDNANNFEYNQMFKKEGQILLQPWHGSMGFKRLDPRSVKNRNWVKKAKMLDTITDYCIVNSQFEIDVFRNSYWPTTNMLKYGHPRNDVLFNLNNEFEEYSKKVKKEYNLDEDTKICLYAPTFRDNSSLESYNLDYEKLHDALVKRFGGKWCILVRFHFKLRKLKIPKKYLNKVINATDYPDIQELMCASDIGITDYSSWLCDFVLTGRPGFLYTSDIEKYIDERGFCYPLESSPFPIAKTNEEFYDKIINFNEKKYKNDIDEFLKDKKCYEDGHACERVMKLIEKLSKKTN